MSTSVFEGTPSVTVVDSRGLIIRNINFCRTEVDGNAETRMTRHQYNTRGALIQSIDPRLYTFQLQDATVKPNITNLSALSGELLRTVSVDAGTTIAMSDAAGRPVLTIGATGVVRTWQYEPAFLPGRLLSITELPAVGAMRITERFIWAGASAQEQASNLAGLCVRHYDTVGMNETKGIALTGILLSINRQLLPDNIDANWQGSAESSWYTLLSPIIFTTQSTGDATGTLLTQTDAMGNIQRQAYDIAGQLKGSWLKLKGGTEQATLKSLSYSAAGEKLSEEQGNGVLTTYRYELETQRLLAMKTERPIGHSAGPKLLQDLQYSYDPVGNVVSIRNNAEEIRYWNNQQILPQNSYSYDSLYQLISTSGREMANIGQQNSNLPPLSSFDNVTYTNYTRTYTYDTANNLTQIRHSSPVSGNNYTKNITVSDRSNRAVLSALVANSSAVEALFTAAGGQKSLQLGQQLSWTPREELMTVQRDNSAEGSENYRYDADSQRILKINTKSIGSNNQTQRVLYLPGLELRTTTVSGNVTENLQVITVANAGQAGVRVLHWETGKPASISNDQLRYSYDNLIGSSGLEVASDGNVISQEEYYPYGGTAVWLARSQMEADYKVRRYSGKERDTTGLYYYGYRYNQPWVGRWLSADPIGSADGLNMFCMVGNNPIRFYDLVGLNKDDDRYWDKESLTSYYAYLAILKRHLKTLDRSLSAAGDSENMKKNIALLAVSGATKSGVSAAGGAVGGIVGAALGSVALPVVGTVVGGAVGIGIGVISGKIVDYARDKIAYKFGIVSPYPKTSEMLFDLDHYDDNFFAKKIRHFTQKRNLKNFGTSTLSGQVVNEVVNEAAGTAFIRIPVFELGNLAYHANKASKGLSIKKAQHISDIMDQFQEILDANHSDAINFMRTEYGDNEMLMTGVMSRLKRSRLSINTLARAKNKVDTRIQSIHQKTQLRLTGPVRRPSFSEL